MQTKLHMKMMTNDDSQLDVTSFKKITMHICVCVQLPVNINYYANTVKLRIIKNTDNLAINYVLRSM